MAQVAISLRERMVNVSCEVPYDYVLGFGHHLFNAGPPIKIERMDVPVRLEKRLAELLHDLAEHKHMSLSRVAWRKSCCTPTSRWATASPARTPRARSATFRN